MSTQFYSFQHYQCSYQDSGIEKGKGKDKPLIFLHNGAMDHQVFSHQFDYFKSHRRIIALDFLGYGLSDKPKITFDTQLYVEQLAALVEHLGLKRFDIVGCCIGGAVAVEYCLEYGSSVDSLSIITLDAPEVIEAGILGVSAKYSPFGSLRQKLGSYLMTTRLGIKVFRRMLMQHQLGRYHQQEPEWDKQCEQYYGDPDVAYTFSNFNPETSVLRGLVRPKNFPTTLVIWGEDNDILPATTGINWAKHFGADQILCVPNTGYMVLREAATDVNQAIAAIMNDDLVSAA